MSTFENFAFMCHTKQLVKLMAYNFIASFDLESHGAYHDDGSMINTAIVICAQQIFKDYPDRSLTAVRDVHKKTFSMYMMSDQPFLLAQITITCRWRYTF